MTDSQDSQIPWNAEARIACAFSFQCPKTWERLESTADPTVRHFTTCDRDVQLAQTEADFRHYHEQGGYCQVNVLQRISDVFAEGRHHPSCTHDVLPNLERLST